MRHQDDPNLYIIAVGPQGPNNRWKCIKCGHIDNLSNILQATCSTIKKDATPQLVKSNTFSVSNNAIHEIIGQVLFDALPPCLGGGCWGGCPHDPRPYVEKMVKIGMLQIVENGEIDADE